MCGVRRVRARSVGSMGCNYMQPTAYVCITEEQDVARQILGDERAEIVQKPSVFLIAKPSCAGLIENNRLSSQGEERRLAFRPRKMSMTVEGAVKWLLTKPFRMSKERATRKQGRARKTSKQGEQVSILGARKSVRTPYQIDNTQLKALLFLASKSRARPVPLSNFTL
jgi:hypothetical protein